MRPERFDTLSRTFGRRLASRGMSRRVAIRGVGAATVATAAAVARHQPAAADCPDVSSCIGPCGPSYICTPPRFPLPGGPVGACWDGFLGCNPCHVTWAELNARCNQANPACRGECTATFPF